MRPGCSLRKAGGRIFSALPEGSSSGAYDGRAKLYDAIVGSKLYNRLLWGTSVDSYRMFARHAVINDIGKYLDAGSGSAIFTSEAYAASERPIMLVDRSIGMLNAAEKNILATADEAKSEHVTFIQADLFDLPFQKGSFSTVLSMGMLHLFENKSGLIVELLDFVAEGGQLYLSSLVTDRKVGRKYLSLLHSVGEVTKPHTFQETRSVVIKAASGTDKFEARLEGNMAYFIITK